MFISVIVRTDALITVIYRSTARQLGKENFSEEMEDIKNECWMIKGYETSRLLSPGPTA